MSCELEEQLSSYARELYHTPYEMFSRFLMESPMCLLPSEAARHLEQGWGLGCAEKTRLMAARLDELGVKNRVLSGGMEYWINGINALSQRGHASQPIEEREEFIMPLFGPGRRTHAYELPPQLSHWANFFTIGQTHYLVDTTGEFTTLKLFSDQSVDDLLFRRPKSHLLYLPFKLRLFYHLPSSELVDLVTRKELEEPRYAVSRILTTVLYGSPWYLLDVKWWWRQSAMDAAIEATVEEERAFDGAISCRWAASPEELQRDFPAAMSDQLWDGLCRAWPRVLENLDRFLNRPPFARLLLIKAENGAITSCSSNEVIHSETGASTQGSASSEG